MNEKTPSGKNGQRGFEYGGVLTRAGEFLPFFFSLFSLSSLYFFMEEEVNDDVVWKEQSFGEFDSLKSESSSFFFRFFFVRKLLDHTSIDQDNRV